MSSGTSNAISLYPVPWGRLRSWIDAQEAAESNGDDGAHISRVQYAALSHFVEFVQDPEPDMANADYVSDLMHTLQIRKQVPPFYEDLDPVDVPIDGVFLKRWRTVCILKSHGNRKFPCIGYGIVNHKKGIPLFKNKKVAKQYAAKQALAFLNREQANLHARASNSPSPGGALSRTTAPSDSRSPRPSSAINSTEPAVSPSGSEIDDPVSPLIKREPSDVVSLGSSHLNDEDAVRQVADFAGQLGISGPAYIITADEGSTEFFSGYPEFNNGGTIPPDLGHVSRVLGRKKAKQEIARLVLEWMVEEKERRRELIGDIMSSPRGE